MNTYLTSAYAVTGHIADCHCTNSELQIIFFFIQAPQSYCNSHPVIIQSNANLLAPYDGIRHRGLHQTDFDSARKLKRWWDRRQHSQHHQPHQPQPHYDQWDPAGEHGLPGQVPPGSHGQTPATDPHYVALRNQAIQENNLMKSKFDDAHQAYSSGQKGKAKEISNQGKYHQQRRNELNQQAAAWIFKETNRRSPPGTIDLHGLYVHESISYTESFIEREQRTGGQKTLRVIVGKGIHSAHHIPRLKPAIENMVTKYDLAIHVDPHNAGVLLLDLGTGKAGRGIDQDVSQRLERPNQDSCQLM